MRTLILLIITLPFALAGQHGMLLAVDAGAGPQLLLDAYPGAAAAYSVRKLRDAYAGQCVRVRRSSDNTQQDIGFASNLIDESALASFCGAGSCWVVTWYDQSGNARDVTTATESRQPVIYASGSPITQNSLPSIYTVSSGAKKLQWSTTSFPSTGDVAFDFFGVYNFSGATLDQLTAGLFSIQPVDYVVDRRCINPAIKDSGTQHSIRLNGGNARYTASQSGFLVWNSNYPSGGGVVNSRINGSPLSVAGSSIGVLNIQSSSGITLFAGGASQIDVATAPSANTVGYISEAIWYFSAQSDRADIETNINNYFSIY
jgi:hypothetical protein